MIVTFDAQKPLPLGGLFGDDIHIYDKDLATIDEILRDPELYEVLRETIIRNNPKNAFKGPRRTAINRVLRLFVLKHIKSWSFRQLHAELQRNLDYRAFTQFFDDQIPELCEARRRLKHASLGRRMRACQQLGRDGKTAAKGIRP